MFDRRKYLMDGFRGAVGKEPDYWIILNSNEWCHKHGILTEEDLAEIQTLIDAKNAPAQEGPDTTEEKAEGE